MEVLHDWFLHQPLASSVTTQLVRSLITGYVSQPNEYEYWMPESCIEGEIPRDLDGTLFRNGEHLNKVMSMKPSPLPTS